MSLLWDLTTWCYSYAKTTTTKSYMQLNQCRAFEPHEPYVILAEYEMYLRLSLHFIWIKISNGYQIASLEKGFGLCSTTQLSLWIWSLHLKNGVSFCCLLSKVISFILSSLYISIVYWYYPYLWLYVGFDFLGSHMVCIWFCPSNQVLQSGIRAMLTVGRKPRQQWSF